jgi:cold shock protein
MFDLSLVYCALPVAPFLKTTLTSDERSRDGRAAASRFVQIKEAMMATGTVKWFNPTKGYGFIQPQDGGRDVFVHISAVERAGLTSLNEGQTVEYEVGQQPWKRIRGKSQNALTATAHQHLDGASARASDTIGKDLQVFVRDNNVDQALRFSG